MAVELIDEIFNMQAIQQQIAAFTSGVSDCQDKIEGLYSTIKSFKDTNISDLAANTDKLNTSVNNSVQATQKAKQAWDELTNRISAQIAAANDNVTASLKNAQANDTLAKQLAKNKVALDDLSASQAQLKKNFQTGTITLTEYEDSLSQIIAAQQSLKTANQDVNRTISQMTKESQAAATSTDQLSAKLDLLRGQYNKLTAAEKASPTGQALLKETQALDQQVKGEKGKVGDFRPNVGNYAESLSPAFATVKEQLESINAQMSAMEQKAQGVQNFGARTVIAGFGANQHQNSGPTAFATGSGQNVGPVLSEDAEGYAKLTVQAKILEGLLERQAVGFKTANQEMRAVKNTLDALEIAEGDGTEAFEKLNTAYTKAEQKIKDLHREQAILTGDAPAITALTGVAKGLGGAYALGAGAAQLFANGNEKVEKELNQLVAIMTFLQGLEEATSALKERNAIVTALEAEATKALNVVKAIETAIFGKAAVAEEAETAAKIENTVATVANTEAVEASAGAMEAAEGATIGLQTALVGLGIGAIIVGVGILIAKIIQWSQAEEKAARDSAELAEEMERVNQILMERIRLSDEDTEHTKKNLQDALDLAEKSKQSYENIYKVKKATSDLDLQTAEHDLKKAANTNDIGEAYRSIHGEVKDLTAGLDPLLKKQDQLNDISDIWREKQRGAINQSEAYFKIFQKYGVSTTEDQAKSQLESVQKEIDAKKKVIEEKKKLTDAYDQAQINDEGLLVEKIRHEEEEQRKLVLETGLIQVAAVKDRNAKILADARSTSAQRLAAIRSDRDQEMREAQLARNSLDPSSSSQAIKIADEKLYAARAQAQRDFNEKTHEENRKEYERNRDAALDAYKTQLNDQIKAGQDLQAGKNQNNPNPFNPTPKVGLSDRLKGLSEEYAARRDLLNAELKQDLDKEGQNAAEKKAIEVKYDSDLMQLDKNFFQTYQQLEAEAIQQSLKEWDNYYLKRKEQIDEHANDQYVVLNESHEDGKRFTRDRQKIEDQAAVNSARNTVDQAEMERNFTKDGTQGRADADAKLSQSAKDLSDKIRKMREDQQNSTKEQAEQDVQELQMVAGAGFNIAEIGYRQQLMNLENLEKRQARAYEQQSKQIQDSSASQEQKSLRMKILDDQKQAQDEKNARKQRQLDIEKAKFDRDKSIMDIILNTAVAVMKSWPDIPLAIATGIAGAAELAVAVATPLPKYAEGTLDHPGGLALHSEAGEKEFILEPGKPGRWSSGTPTIESLLKHTQVWPASKMEEMAMSGMFVNQHGVLIQTSSDNKKELRELKEAIVWQTREIKSALSKNRPRLVNNIKLDSKFGEHIHKSVFR